MEDHPVIDRRERPSRQVEATLSAAQLRAVAEGHAVELGDDALSRLKVFDTPSNALGLDDVFKSQIACLECKAEGLFSVAQLVIPRFGRAELQSFACPECSFMYRKTRVLEPERHGVDRLPEGRGRRLLLTVRSESDLAREVICADGAYVRAGDGALEATVRDGCMSSVEGVLRLVSNKLAFMRVMTDTAAAEGAEGAGAAPQTVGERATELTDALVAGMRAGTPFELCLEDDSDASHISTFPGDTALVFESYEIESGEAGASSEMEARQGCAFEGPVPGATLQAKHKGRWVTCTVLDFSGMQVTVENEEEGRWGVGLDKIRGCDDPSCHCQGFFEEIQAMMGEGAAPAPAPAPPPESGLAALQRQLHEAHQKKYEGDVLDAFGMDAKDVNEYLNKLVEHEEAQAGVLQATSQKRAENKAKELEAGTEALEQLD